MKNSWYKKGFVFVIVVLFIGVGISLASADKTISSVKKLENQADVHTNCFILGTPTGEIGGLRGTFYNINFGGNFFDYYIIDKSPLRVKYIYNTPSSHPISHVQGFTGFIYAWTYFYPYHTYFMFGSVERVTIEW